MCAVVPVVMRVGWRNIVVKHSKHVGLNEEVFNLEYQIFIQCFGDFIERGKICAVAVVVMGKEARRGWRRWWWGRK